MDIKYCDTSKLSIRQIDKPTAKKMVVKYHYSKLWTKCSVALGLFIDTGKEHSFFDEPEEKIKITKMAWETKGVRSVKNAITIKGQTNFKSTAKDILITSQLRSALIFNKKTKSRNYTLETINKNIYIGLNSNLDVKNNYDPYSSSLRISLFDDCSKLDITYTNTRYNDNFNTQPEETIGITFSMDYLGFFGYEQTTDLFFSEPGNLNYGL